MQADPTTDGAGNGPPRARANDAELAAREAEALELLAAGHGSALAAQTLADRHGVSLRQARRYVANAALELCEPVSPVALDSAAMVSLHRLDLIAGRAMADNDPGLAVRATRAHAAAVAQLRRAVSAPLTRFRLPTSRAAPSAPGDAGDPLPPDCPF